MDDRSVRRWTIEEKVKLLDAITVCIFEHPIVAQWIMEILDRNTEPSDSEKPNNCETCLYRTIPWDAPICDSCTTVNSHYEKDEFEPKAEPQEWWLTENSLDDYRSGFMHGYAQAKHEYEPKTEPQTCGNRECENYDIINDHCMFIEQCHKPKTEPSRVQIVPKTEMVTDCHRLDEPQIIACPIQEEDADYARWLYKDEPLTDAEITELAKAIIHKMIDNGDIAEDAYPDLKQRMHEAVERLDEYYPSEDERSE